MRALLVSIVAAALGAVAGWSVVAYEFRKPEEVVPVRNPSAAEAKVVVEGGNVFDFGTMQVGDTQRHVFVVRNIGNAPLQLTAGQPSCKCTVSEFSTEPVPPGESREIKLTWKPMGAEAKFRQRAPIYTNDPEHRELVLHIAGRVAEFFKMDPNPLALGQFSPTEASTHEINVWGYQETPWQLKGHECLDTATAEFFTVEARDMTAEEIAREPGAVNGQVLTVGVKAGLPLGQVQQRISLAYDNKEDSKPAELSITGKAVGDVTIMAKEYNTTGDYVDFGNVPRGSGKKSTVSLLVKGAYRKDVAFKIKSIDPPGALQAELGDPKSQGKSITWPLAIEVPPGTEPITRLGSATAPLARIELDTGTADVPPCVVKVRLAVSGE